MSIFPSPDFATDIQPPLRLWGLSPLELHDVYWQSRGVTVVRQGAREEFQDAEAFLLIDSQAMALFELRPAIRRLYWVDPMLLSIRLHGLVRNRMVEQQALHPGRTSSFRRGEIANRGSVTRVGLTKHRKIAQEWHENPTPTEAWRGFRREISQSRRAALSLPGVTGEAQSDEQAASIVGHIASIWQRPDLFVDRASRIDSRIWKDTHTDIDIPARGAFPIWLGIGRSTCHETAAHGPVILWDAPNAAPAPRSNPGASSAVENEVAQ
jgi:hypothetical protein